MGRSLAEILEIAEQNGKNISNFVLKLLCFFRKMIMTLFFKNVSNFTKKYVEIVINGIVSGMTSFF
jgi:hypothetical protein